MTLTSLQVKKISQLARLKLDDQQVDKYCGELNKIFKWIEQLNELDTSDIAPINTVVTTGQIMRKDVAVALNNQEVLMQMAPNSKYGHFVVPKVVE